MSTRVKQTLNSILFGSTISVGLSAAYALGAVQAGFGWRVLVFLVTFVVLYALAVWSQKLAVDAANEWAETRRQLILDAITKAQQTELEEEKSE